MKNIYKKIKNILSEINLTLIKNSLTNIIPYLLPESWQSYRKSYILFWSIASFTIIFLIWASIAEVNQVVRAPGVVRPDSKVHLIQSGITGPVEEIKISLADKVEVGDSLFIVDQKPTKAGIDPMNKFVDRDIDDNLIRVDIIYLAEKK